jgi:hypothetical protein
LVLANAPDAILVQGGGDPSAKCGIAIDGGLTQNIGAPIGGINFNGNFAKINVDKLTVAASTAVCPDDGTHCQQFGSTLRLQNVALGTATADPYGPQINTLFSNLPPAGVSAIGVSTAGSGYTANATCMFTVNGGTFYGAASAPAKFTLTTDNKGNIKTNTPRTIIDPGAYAITGFPTGFNATSTNCGSGKNVQFGYTQGCWTFAPTAGANAVANRKYCSINLKGAHGTVNFPAGYYWIAGGDNGCSGFCVSSANTIVTSDTAGVTFLLTNGEGTTANQYASVGITSGTISLCAPGTNCGNSCSLVVGNPASCMLFIQNPAIPCPGSYCSSANGGPPATNNSFNGNGTETLSGLIYLPKETFTIGGNTNTNGCVAVVAKYLNIGGAPTFSDGCLPGNGIGNTTVTTTLSLPHLSQ